MNDPQPKMKHVLSCALYWVVISGFSQSTNVPLNEDYYHRIDRYETKAGKLVNELFTSVKPYKRSAVVAMMDSLEKNSAVFQSAADKFNLEYLRNDSWEWSKASTSDDKKPFYGMYKKKSDLVYVDVPDFDLHVN